jgi:hypothetical protein
VIPMSTLWALVFILGMFIQAGGNPPLPDDALNAAEKAEIARASGVEARIKIYKTASTRIQKDLQSAISKGEFQTVPGILKTWTLLLSGSLKDIEANLKTKKRSRALISYEIQVRKAISVTQGSQIRAPVDQQDVFDSCLSKAEAIRMRFVEILFSR